ncbi:hypothetical protein MPSEU_000664300 [Mayamaea pseudoterrestris]|nr:hypothetical protein MPSEU_000664300 [Mayamaea pseudoterrestris]
MSTSTRLQLHLRAKDLKNLQKSVLGRNTVSHPFCVVTVRGDSPDNQPHIVGQTEVIFKSLSPSWSRTIFLDGYKFGVPYYIEIGVFDFDANSTGKTDVELARMDLHSQTVLTKNAGTRELMRTGTFPHKVMGTALLEVGQILASRGNLASKSLQTGGQVYAHIERCSSASHSHGKDGGAQVMSFQLQAKSLQNVQTLGRTSSPFFELYRKVDRPTGATWISVYRSNVVKSDLNPLWTEVTLDMEATCNGDLSRAMKVIVWDHRRTGKHKLIGEFETSMKGFAQAKLSDDAMDGGDEVGFTLMRQGNETGIVLVADATLIGGSGGKASDKDDSSTVESSSHNGGANPISSNHGKKKSKSSRRTRRRPEFVDYLSSGCQISLAVAIDFTASNGDPRQPGTPHYFHPSDSKEWNDYEKAIFAVGSILAKYDSDQKFPIWGFGAKYRDVVRHCFQCGTEVEVEGVQGIMDAYRGVFRTPLTMSFPTRFDAVIETAAAYARHEQEVAEQEGKLSYTILLILTAGNVENVRETKQQLMEASEDPLSVVIVGIGEADFAGMQFLDDFDPATDSGRDITKFVRFTDYRSFNSLTEAVLDEIPDQLVSYYYDIKNILPGATETEADDAVNVEDADDETRTFTFLG